jgi:hypothetical protein
MNIYKLFNESTASIDSLLCFGRMIGKIQWRRIGQDAENDVASWLGCIDRAIEAVKVQDIANAEENLKLAREIEERWNTFSEIAIRIIRVLEPMHDPAALA